MNVLFRKRVHIHNVVAREGASTDGSTQHIVTSGDTIERRTMCNRASEREE